MEEDPRTVNPKSDFVVTFYVFIYFILIESFRPVFLAF